MPALEHEVQLKLQRILLATNFKAESEAAAQFAKALAAHFSSKVTVVHVFDSSLSTRSEAAVFGLPNELSRHSIVQDMEKTLHELHEAGVKAHGHIVETHNSSAAILGLAHELAVDAIVMGTAARHGLKKFIIGSCAEDVIRHADCPVFTLGPKAKENTIGSLGISNILFPTDLQRDVVEKAGAALSLAKSNAAYIHLCHVMGREGKTFEATVDLQLRAEEALRRLIPEPAYEWGCPRVVVEFGEISDQILKAAKRVAADLIVLGARRSKTWFPHIIAGIVDEVLAEAECPVMTICTDSR